MDHPLPSVRIPAVHPHGQPWRTPQNRLKAAKSGDTLELDVTSIGNDVTPFRIPCCANRRLEDPLTSLMRMVGAAPFPRDRHRHLPLVGCFARQPVPQRLFWITPPNRRPRAHPKGRTPMSAGEARPHPPSRTSRTRRAPPRGREAGRHSPSAPEGMPRRAPYRRILRRI